MKHLNLYKLAAVVAALLCVFSCKKDNTLRYGNVTMGNFAEDKFISDQGNEFTIVENLTGDTFEGIERAIMQCDVLKKIDGTENCYEVRVHNLAEVLDKMPISSVKAAEDPEKVVEDPISIQQLWVAGGYLNMYVMFEVQAYPENTDRKHMVNLVYIQEDLDKGKYTLALRHNAYGETLSAEKNEDTPAEGEGTPQEQSTELIQWGLAGAYVSFPISTLVTEQEATLKLFWKEHVIINNVITSDTMDRSVDISYSKDYFEHTPLVVKSRTAAIK